MSRWVLLALLLSGPDLAAQRLATAPWSGADRAWMGAAAGAIATDCAYTIHALRQPDVIERNPLLGERPHPATVVTFCAMGTLATFVLADVLSPKARRWFLRGVVAVEVGFVVFSVANTL